MKQTQSFGRRQILKLLGMSAAGLVLPTLAGSPPAQAQKRHIITLSFDDGFKKSTLLTAQLFEKYKLPACINVIATGHLKNFKSPDEYQVTEKGDFILWNELKARGHEIMPHGYSHVNKASVPLNEAQDLIRKCLDYFSENLKGFNAAQAIYNMPYNASTPELEHWLSEQVLAFRTLGAGINPLPFKGQKKLTCTGFGPGSTEDFLEDQIKKLLELPEGWLIYNVHGLDGEGWGPMRFEFLDRLLGRLVGIDSVALIPAGKALLAVK